MKYKKQLSYCVLALLAIAAIVLLKNALDFKQSSPELFYKEYLETCKNGYTDAVDYVYFDNAWESTFYTGNPYDKLLEYKIYEITEINDFLTAFKVEFESASDRALGKKTTAYNFVAVIHGQYKVITNSRNIPENLRENFDEDKYQNSAGENEVSADEVL